MMTRTKAGAPRGRRPLPVERRLGTILNTRVNASTVGTFRHYSQALNLTEAELLRALLIKGLQDLSEGWRP